MGRAHGARSDRKCAVRATLTPVTHADGVRGCRSSTPLAILAAKDFGLGNKSGPGTAVPAPPVWPVRSRMATRMRLWALSHQLTWSGSQSALAPTQQVSFASFLESGAFSDVTIVSGTGTRLPAHRVLLCAQSDAFDAMLRRAGFAETGTNEVRLAEWSDRALRLALTFFYTGECRFAPDEAAVGLQVLRVRARLAGLALAMRTADDGPHRASALGHRWGGGGRRFLRL